MSKSGLRNEINKAAKALGSMGGKSTRDRYGKEHYRRLAQNMNRKIMEKKRLSARRSSQGE
jgi:hypothetical protein